MGAVSRCPCVCLHPIREGREAGPRETSGGYGAGAHLFPFRSGGYGAGAHLFPFRTEKLSPAATMILRETVGK